MTEGMSENRRAMYVADLISGIKRGSLDTYLVEIAGAIAVRTREIKEKG